MTVTPPPAAFEVELEARLVTSPARPGGRGNVDLTYAEEGHEDRFNRRVRGDAWRSFQVCLSPMT